MNIFKSHYRENKAYWIVMIASLILLFTYFNDDVKGSFRTFLSWTFAAASYKIFIEDLTIKRVDAKNLSMNNAVEKTASFYERVAGIKKK